MSPLDHAIIGAYLLGALLLGIALTRRASSSSDEYFLAGRSLPWWLAGTSMVATTFAADTPLAVTGLVASGGVAGNWVWWSTAFAHLLAALLFARYWRRLRVVTDAEVLELRYTGTLAVILRGTKAAYQALFINCLTMGWVILAMNKVCQHLFPEVDPVQLTFGLMGLAVLYSLLGGMRSVVITDLVQFSLAMFGAVLLAVYVVGEQGGIQGLLEGLERTYGEERSAALLAFLPQGDLPGLPLTLFAVLLTVGWWKQADGGGYMAQRMAATRDAGEAERASIWFAVLHNAIRPWPWILVGLAALVVWPLDSHPDLDREATYPMLLVRSLPPGLLGLVVASLLAAFMSTIDTHVNWGASYVVTDVWQRFRGEAHGVLVGRLAVLAMGLVAALVSLRMDSIVEVWLFVIMLGSGLGSIAVVRWLWWRVNAASELVALVAATVLSVGIVLIGDVPKAWGILIVALGSLGAWVPVALLGPQTDAATLDRFYRLARPVGAWGPVAARNPEVDTALESSLPLRVVAGAVAVFGTLFGIGGGLLVHPAAWGIALAGLGCTAWLITSARR